LGRVLATDSGGSLISVALRFAALGLDGPGCSWASKFTSPDLPLASFARVRSRQRVVGAIDSSEDTSSGSELEGPACWSSIFGASWLPPDVRLRQSSVSSSVAFPMLKLTAIDFNSSWLINDSFNGGSLSRFLSC